MHDHFSMYYAQRKKQIKLFLSFKDVVIYPLLPYRSIAAISSVSSNLRRHFAFPDNKIFYNFQSNLPSFLQNLQSCYKAVGDHFASVSVWTVWKIRFFKLTCDYIPWCRHESLSQQKYFMLRQYWHFKIWPVRSNSNYHSLYSILDFDWLIHLQITACKYRSAANNWC